MSRLGGGRGILAIALLGAVALAAYVVAVARATAVTSVTITSDHGYVSADPTATWTIDFTTSGSGALVIGNAVDVTFPAGFNVAGATAAFTATGFTGGCTTPTVVIISGQTVSVPLTGGTCQLAANTAAEITISGISAGATQYSRLGFSVLTYADTTFTTPIDGSGGHPPSPIDILASVTYASTTSAGGAVTSGSAPTDPSTPYSTVIAPTVTVLGNTGSLVLNGYTFGGWCDTNVAANPTLCTGTSYNAADTFTIAANTTLYSKWTRNSDGAGTLAVSPSTATASTAATTLVFTYTAPAGGTNGGEVDIDVPTGWNVPSITNGTAGCTTASTGSVAVVSRTIQVTGLNLAGGATETIRYGDRTGACNTGPGATVTSTVGASSFSTTQKTTSGGSLAAIGASPSVNVTAATAADGTGTLTVLPSSVTAGDTGKTVVFTYTAAAGGTNVGELDITVPAGWTTPSTAVGAGCTLWSGGSVVVAGSKIKVTGLTLAGAGTATVTYGATTGSCAGSGGAAAPLTATTSTFTATEKSTFLGTLSPIGSASITINSPPASNVLEWRVPIGRHLRPRHHVLIEPVRGDTAKWHDRPRLSGDHRLPANAVRVTAADSDF